jgi:prenyltransferase beta subunit
MIRLGLILTGGIFFLCDPLEGGETGVKDTIIYLHNLEDPGGGFWPIRPIDAKPPTQPSLRATSAAARALHYFGGELKNKKACISFVGNCFDPETGGFRDTTGAEPDLFSTAVGVMAVVELKMPTEKYAQPAIKYLSEHAKSFEDIRIVAAALESLGKSSPRNQEWLKDIRNSKNADGTYGKGVGKARATGGAVAAILRLGGKVDDRDRVLAALRQGQRKSGGFGKEDAGDASDLETTYRVMRTFMMLKARPDDVAGLEAFIAKCRNSDGGYGVAPGQPSSVSGTYYAASIRHWLK